MQVGMVGNKCKVKNQTKVRERELRSCWWSLFQSNFQLIIVSEKFTNANFT